MTRAAGPRPLRRVATEPAFAYRFGQPIFVDPASRLVLVHTAVRRLPVDPGGQERLVDRSAA